MVEFVSINEPRGSGSLATVIIVNYNSSGILDIVSESIRASLRLTYRPLEIIIVDNGSNDGSYEAIKKLVIREAPSDIGVKLVHLDENLGFVGANIVGFSIKSPKCKYVALINNDLAPEPNSLARLIRWLEGYPRVAGVQGLILRWDGGKTDSYGTYIGDWWERIDIKPKDRTKLRPIPVTYLLGAYSVYRVEALERCGGLFLPHLFVYSDDAELGIRLWRCGYILLAVPVEAGRHWGGATLNKMSLIKYYYGLRNWTALIMMHMNAESIFMAPFLLTNPPRIHGVMLGLRLRGVVRRVVGEGMEPRIRIPIQEFIRRRVLWSLSPEKARQDMVMRAVKTHIMLGFRPDVHSLYDSYV